MYLIRERLFRLGEDSDITDEHGRPALHVDGKVLSLRNRLVLRDPEGWEVAQVQRKLVAMRPTYQISISGQDDLLILASVLALDLAQDEERQQH
jgi:uncharacterized protein YxjI